MNLGVRAAVVGDRLLPGDVQVHDGRITAVGVPSADGHGIAAPGLVDVQVNGYAGHDFAAVDADDLAEVRRALARDGVTAFVATVITGNQDNTLAAVRRLAAAPRRMDGGAELLGVHLEGPWISPARLGTHPAALRRDPDAAAVAALTTDPRVTMVTLAPELPGALDAVSTLVTRGVVVVLGHSDATAAQADAAYDRGASGATHLYNAMAPLHHRDPGLIGATLTRPDVVAGLIVDGHHLAPEIVALTFAAMPGRVALVTDATAAAGMPDGEYDLGGVRLTSADGAVRNAAGGLAGSASTLARCVREAVRCGIDPAVALHAATTVPAAHAQRADLGRLRPGAAADITVFDDDLIVRRVLVDGEETT